MKHEWYMISTISGKEDTVVESLKNKVERAGMSEFFEEFKIFWVPAIAPGELIKKAQGVSYRIKQENLYKGYIFIRMHMSDDAWFLVRNTEYVTGLVGSSGKGAKPTPISAREYRKMLDKQHQKAHEFASIEYKNPYQEGAKVRVKEGSFKNEQGIIVETNFDALTAVVEIQTFGRKVPTEFPYNNLQILDDK